MYGYQTSAVSFILLFTRGSEGRDLINAFVYIWKMRNWRLRRAKPGRPNKRNKENMEKCKLLFLYN